MQLDLFGPQPGDRIEFERFPGDDCRPQLLQPNGRGWLVEGWDTTPTGRRARWRLAVHQDDDGRWVRDPSPWERS